jgi:hypothetical protein
MRWYFLAVIALIPIACRGKNYFSDQTSENATVLEQAVNDLQDGNPEQAETRIIETFPVEQQAFFKSADPTDPAFTENLSTSLAALSNEQRDSLSILAQAKVEKAGINYLDFAAKLASKIPDASSLHLNLGDCAYDPEFKNLVDSVADRTDSNDITVARFLASAAGYSISLHKLAKTPDLTSPRYLPRGIALATVIFKITSTALMDFGAIIADGDTDHDYKISAAEAEALFSNPETALTRANNTYDLLNIAATSITDLAHVASKGATPSESTQAAIDRLNGYRQQLLTFAVVNSTAGCSDEERTEASTVACVKQWVVARTNCKL